jgi:hypothetical protein
MVAARDTTSRSRCWQRETSRQIGNTNWRGHDDVIQTKLAEAQQAQAVLPHQWSPAEPDSAGRAPWLHLALAPTTGLGIAARSFSPALAGAPNQCKKDPIDSIHELTFRKQRDLRVVDFPRGKADGYRLRTPPDASSGKVLWLAGFVSESNAISITYVFAVLF